MHKSSIICLLVALLLIGLCAPIATAATYYVDVTNPAASDDNAGTEDLPWATIDNGDVKKLLLPGDTVVVKPGTYAGIVNNTIWPGWKHIAFSTVSGEKDNPITYMAAGPGVVLDGTAGDGPDAAVGVWMIGVQGATLVHDIVIDGFEFTKGCSGLLINNSQRITARNCTFYELGTSPLCGAIYDCGGTDNVYTDNNIHHLRPAGFGGWNCGWWFQRATNTIVARNVITDTLAPASAFAFLVNQGSGVKFINNTAPEPAVNFIRCWDAPKDAVVANNIVGQCQEALYNQDTATLTSTYNMYYGCATVYGRNILPGPGDFIGLDPGFVGPGDYHLASTSPLINAGKDMELPFNGPAPDLGCFETDSTIAPSLVTGTVTMGSGVIPGVAITVNTGESAITDDETGAYRIPLAPAAYTISATLAGWEFSPADPWVEIEAAKTTIQNFTAPFDPKIYHVDVNSASASNYGPGTEEQPWQNIDAGDIQKILKPGDTILVHPGAYLLNTNLDDIYLTTTNLQNCSGLRGLPVTYKATGPGVVIDGAIETEDPNIIVCGFYSKDTHDIMIDGFEFTRLAVGSYAENTYRYTVKNCEFHHMINTSKWISNSSFAIYDEAGANSVYTNNVFHDTVAPNHAGGAWLKGCSDIEVSRSLMYNVSGTTAEILVPEACRNVKLLNNTQDGGSNLLRAWNGCKNTVVTNNIVVSVTEDAIHNEDAAGAVVNSYNLFSFCAANWSPNASQGPGEFTADPAFVGGEPFDYHLSSDSPAIDAGTYVGFPFQYTAPDLGAFESPYPAPAIEVQSVMDLKKVAPGKSINLSAPAQATMAVPGGAFDGFYIEDTNRVSGIKVLAGTGFTLPIIAEGDSMAIKGTLNRDANGELCVYATEIVKLEATPLGALGMINKSVPACDNTGLLVTIWGNITGSTSDAIYIDDGSGVDDGLGIAKGVRVILNGLTAPTSGMVVVTGEAGLYKEGTKTVSAIRPRVATDIR